MLGCMLMIQASAQTDFDSLKRNSNFDTSYRPSQKPTFVTEFAEVTISGFIQPAFYFDNNNVLNNDVFVTSEIPTTRVTNIKFQRFHLSANQSSLALILNFQKPVPILLPSWKVIFIKYQGRKYFFPSAACLYYPWRIFSWANVDQLWRCKFVAQYTRS